MIGTWLKWLCVLILCSELHATNGVYRVNRQDFASNGDVGGSAAYRESPFENREGVYRVQRQNFVNTNDVPFSDTYHGFHANRFSKLYHGYVTNTSRQAPKLFAPSTRNPYLAIGLPNYDRVVPVSRFDNDGRISTVERSTRPPKVHRSDGVLPALPSLDGDAPLPALSDVSGSSTDEDMSTMVEQFDVSDDKKTICRGNDCVSKVDSRAAAPIRRPRSLRFYTSYNNPDSREHDHTNCFGHDYDWSNSYPWTRYKSPFFKHRGRPFFLDDFLQLYASVKSTTEPAHVAEAETVTASNTEDEPTPMHDEEETTSELEMLTTTVEPALNGDDSETIPTFDTDSENVEETTTETDDRVAAPVRRRRSVYFGDSYDNLHSDPVPYYSGWSSYYNAQPRLFHPQPWTRYESPYFEHRPRPYFGGVPPRFYDSVTSMTEPAYVAEAETVTASDNEDDLTPMFDEEETTNESEVPTTTVEPVFNGDDSETIPTVDTDSENVEETTTDTAASNTDELKKQFLRSFVLNYIQRRNSFNYQNPDSWQSDRFADRLRRLILLSAILRRNMENPHEIVTEESVTDDVITESPDMTENYETGSDTDAAETTPSVVFEVDGDSTAESSTPSYDNTDVDGVMNPNEEEFNSDSTSTDSEVDQTTTENYDSDEYANERAEFRRRMLRLIFRRFSTTEQPTETESITDSTVPSSDEYSGGIACEFGRDPDAPNEDYPVDVDSTTEEVRETTSENVSTAVDGDSTAESTTPSNDNIDVDGVMNPDEEEFNSDSTTTESEVDPSTTKIYESVEYINEEEAELGLQTTSEDLSTTEQPTETESITDSTVLFTNESVVIIHARETLSEHPPDSDAETTPSASTDYDTTPETTVQNEGFDYDYGWRTNDDSISTTTPEPEPVTNGDTDDVDAGVTENLENGHSRNQTKFETVLTEIQQPQPIPLQSTPESYDFINIDNIDSAIYNDETNTTPEPAPEPSTTPEPEPSVIVV